MSCRGALFSEKPFEAKDAFPLDVHARALFFLPPLGGARRQYRPAPAPAGVVRNPALPPPNHASGDQIGPPARETHAMNEFSTNAQNRLVDHAARPRNLPIHPVTALR